MKMRIVSMASILHQPSITSTGASGACDYGGGFIVGSKWGFYPFSNVDNEYGVNHRAMSINYQEAHAVIMLLYNYCQVLTGHKLLLYIDNTAVLYSIYRHWAGSLGLMEYIHEIALMLCLCRIELRVEYLPSSFNKLADSLSRFELDRFHQTVSSYKLRIEPRPTPLEYYPILKLMRSD